MFYEGGDERVWSEDRHLSNKYDQVKKNLTAHFYFA